jgi:hypothetical protein
VSRNRTFYDPALAPEARMNRMREEMYALRRTVVSLVPEKFQGGLSSVVVQYNPKNR